MLRFYRTLHVRVFDCRNLPLRMIAKDLVVKIL